MWNINEIGDSVLDPGLGGDQAYRILLGQLIKFKNGLENIIAILNFLILDNCIWWCSHISVFALREYTLILFLGNRHIEESEKSVSNFLPDGSYIYKMIKQLSKM